MKLIGMVVCWWQDEHHWSKWTGLRYTDGRTWYWTRICHRCHRIESTLKEPK